MHVDYLLRSSHFDVGSLCLSLLCCQLSSPQVASFDCMKKANHREMFLLMKVLYLGSLREKCYLLIIYFNEIEIHTISLRAPLPILNSDVFVVKSI